MSNVADKTAEIAVALRPLALLASGQTGADIERLIRETRSCARRQGRSMTWADLESAMATLSRPPDTKLDWSIAVHEIGHAIAYSALEFGQVDTVRIGGRGGETRLSTEIRQMQSEQGLKALIACILAGRTAEMMIFGESMIGAGGSVDSDLGKATALAVDMETSLGLGGHMPLVYRPPQNTSDMLHYDHALADRVNARLEAGATTAYGILMEHRKVLVELARRLQVVRVLEGDDVRNALAKSVTDAC